VPLPKGWPDYREQETVEEMTRRIYSGLGLEPPPMTVKRGAPPMDVSVGGAPVDDDRAENVARGQRRLAEMGALATVIAVAAVVLALVAFIALLRLARRQPRPAPYPIEIQALRRPAKMWVWIRSHKTFVAGVLVFAIGLSVCVSTLVQLREFISYAVNSGGVALVVGYLLDVHTGYVKILVAGFAGIVLGGAIALTSVFGAASAAAAVLAGAAIKASMRQRDRIRDKGKRALAAVRRPLIKQMLVTAAVVAVGLVVYWLATGRDCPAKYENSIHGRSLYRPTIHEALDSLYVTTKVVEGHRHGILGLGKCYWHGGGYGHNDYYTRP
jgi:hypothetical protein